MSRFHFWSAWVGANALGEAIGLGAVFVIGLFVATTIGEPSTVAALGLLGILVIVLASLEGAVVGYAQWLVLRRRYVDVRRSSWIVATVIGAVTAWVLGMIPSTMASLSQGSEPAAVQSMPDPRTVLFAAAAMGLVLGMVLSFAQWWVIRRHARAAIWWLPANALAWALAMPLIFWLVGATVSETQSPSSVGLLVTGIAVAGALVGAVHGLFLVSVISPAET